MTRAALILVFSLGWGATASAGPTCAEWLRFSTAEQKAGMVAFLEQSLPKSVPA